MIKGYHGLDDINFFEARRNHIIGIGINDYKFASNIEYCKSDVDKFIEIMITHYDGFEEDRVTTIYSNHQRQPTKSLILNTLKNKISCLTHGDNVIIYLAGHGISNDSMFYFAIYNSKEKDLYSFISLQEILKILDRQFVKHFVLIIDACYSGKIFHIHRGFEEGKLEENANFWKKIYVKKSIWALTSGSIEPVAAKSPFSDTMLKVFISFAKSEKQLLISDLRHKIILYLDKDATQTPLVGRLNNVEGFEDPGGEFVFLPRPLEKHKEPKSKEDSGKIEEHTPQKSPNPPTESSSRGVEKEPPTYEPPKFTDPEPLENLTKKSIPFLVKFLTYFIILAVIGIIQFNQSKKGHIPETSKDSRIASPTIPTYIPRNYPGLPQPISIKKPYRSKPILPDTDKIFAYEDTMTISNLVFVGSFENKQNAEAILEKLKIIGYDDAEIIMKENLPFAVVVSGFYQFKSSAKAEVKALKNRGFEVYSSKMDLVRIYRKKGS